MQAIVPAMVEGAIQPAGGDDLAPFKDGQVQTARGLLRKFRQRRAGWLGHFRSFLGVNLGLAGINVLSGLAAESFFPWFLFVTASWGIGLVIHGMSHRGWLRDAERSIEQAEAILGASRFDDDLLFLPPAPSDDDEAPPALVGAEEAPPALPRAEVEERDAASEEGWGELMTACGEAVVAASQALDRAGVEGEVNDSTREQLDKGLRTIEVVQRGARSIREAIRAVAPEGVESLARELSALEARIAAARDERLKGVYEANRRLLEARRDKLEALTAEEERMRATVQGFLLAAQNVRLDAARLGAGHVPGQVAALGDSLDRLDQEVEVVRQVEAELEML